MAITAEQHDAIYNALLIGMTLKDAYVYAGFSPAQIAAAEEDEQLQLRWHQLIKQHEFALLDDLKGIIEKQTKMGKEGAVTWALEHMYSARYANKTAGEGKTVNIVFGSKDPVTEDTVEIHD